MGTIMDYAREETRAFSQYPFHIADAVVFAMLSYDRIPREVPQLSTIVKRNRNLIARMHSFDFKHPVASTRSLFKVPFKGPTVQQVEEELIAYNRDHPLTAQAFGQPSLDRQFYQIIARNPRFSAVRVSAAEERFDSDKQTQFAAETFQLPDGTLVIAFRGTDDSLVGWKEDFNMAYTYPVPAQKYAADYIEDIGHLWSGKIILTGHSKGGNLAIYAAMNAPDEIKDRIEHIYSLDGPGFNLDVINSYEYSTIVHRITKMVPDSSIIGMLLNTSPHENRIVVQSNNDGLQQHSCYTWIMDGDKFVEADDLSDSSKNFNEAINTWLQGMTQRQREHGVEALFHVLNSSGMHTITELMNAGPRIIPELLSSYVGLRGEDRKYINQALWMLATAALSHNHH